MDVAKYSVAKDIICYLQKECTCYSLSHEGISSKFDSGLISHDLGWSLSLRNKFVISVTLPLYRSQSSFSL